jgi:hypothetical protein
MGKDTLRYDRMVEEALRGVVRRALVEVSERGLPGGHHFYITFDTTEPGVHMSDVLKERYPTEMTVVLQYQFWGLEVEDAAFAVTLSFNDRHERIRVPFEAITAFADPAVKFGLRFENQDAAATGAPGKDAEPVPGAAPGKKAPATGGPASPTSGDGAKIVALETFRKK